MTLRRVTISLLAAAGWILAGFLGVFLYALLQRPFDDAISLAGRHTRELLALHARHDQSDRVITWLTQYHGEAPSHQIMISFVHWATSNSAATENLLDRLPSTSEMTARLAFAVMDSGQAEKFCDAFARSTAQSVKAVFAEMRRFDPASACG